MCRVPTAFLDFLNELDALLEERTELHCLGGFVVSALFGLERPTADIDILSILPGDSTVLALAGKGSALHLKHRVYLDMVTIMTPPFEYATRLVDMFPRAFTHLRLRALDPYDLALSKLERNGDQDREDVKRLAIQVPLDTGTLVRRYQSELRYLLANAARHDLTMDLWVSMIAELQATRSAERDS